MLEHRDNFRRARITPHLVLPTIIAPSCTTVRRLVLILRAHEWRWSLTRVRDFDCYKKKKKTKTTKTNIRVPFLSDNKAFTKDSKEYTIVTRDQNYQNTIGTTEHLSFYDAKIVNTTYRLTEYNFNFQCKQTIKLTWLLGYLFVQSFFTFFGLRRGWSYVILL